MKLIDPNTGLMVCKVCGTKHWANIRPNSNGMYFRGSWQCQHGCMINSEKEEVSSELK